MKITFEQDERLSGADKALDELLEKFNVAINYDPHTMDYFFVLCPDKKPVLKIVSNESH